MYELIELILALSIIACFIFYINKGASNNKLCQKSEKWIPKGLEHARLIAVERRLELDGEFHIKGRVDRLYEYPNKQLVVVERKNRKVEQIYPTDILQLSLYAYILERHDKQVSAFGYVVFNDSRTAKLVLLYDRSTVEEKLNRYRMLRNKAISPKKVRGKKCHSCSHSSRCEKVV